MNYSDDDRFIEEVKARTNTLEQEGLTVRRFQVPPAFELVNLLKDDKGGSIIGRADTVVELGHPSTTALCLGMVTENEDLIVESQVTVIGRELRDLSAGRYPFALVVLAQVAEANESSRHALLRKMSSCDRLMGCMARVSSGRIWIRFSQDAIDHRLTLKDLGWLLLSELKEEQTRFTKAEVILVVGREHHIDGLRSIAEGLAEERGARYKAALTEKMGCETGLDCEECPETETCRVLKDAVAVARRRSL